MKTSDVSGALLLDWPATRARWPAEIIDMSAALLSHQLSTDSQRVNISKHNEAEENTTGSLW